MKPIIVFASLLFSFTAMTKASAAPTAGGSTPQIVYDIKVDLTIGGKTISPVEILVKANESALLTQTTGTEQTYIDVTPIPKIMSGKPAVHLKFEVGKISLKGDKTVLSKPQLIVHEGQTVNMVMAKASTGTEEIALKVLVEKKI